MMWWLLRANDDDPRVSYKRALWEIICCKKHPTPSQDCRLKLACTKANIDLQLISEPAIETLDVETLYTE